MISLTSTGFMAWSANKSTYTYEMSLLIQTFISVGRIESYLKDIRRFFL